MPNLQMSPSTVSAPAPPQLAASTSQLTPATSSLITWHVAPWADTCLWSRGSSVAPLPGSWLADGNPRTEETATRVPAPAPAPRPGRRSSGAVARASNESSRRLRKVSQSQFSWLKLHTSAVTFKTLLRHYAFSMIVQLHRLIDLRH